MELLHHEIDLMAQIFPELSALDLNGIDSTAESKIYSALKDQLSDDFLVLFQPRWILKTESNSARDGETDFLIAHSDFGFFTLEVKGGGIHFDGSAWTSIARTGLSHSIKDPIKQAMQAKYAIRQKLIEINSSSTNTFKDISIGHAIFFPDVDKKEAFIRSDLPEQLIGSRKDVATIELWVKGVLRFWSQESPKPLGSNGIQVLQKTLAKSIHVDQSIAADLEYLAKRRVDLTFSQLKVLDFISFHRRAAICGGAGTGKTILAMEKVQRLANEGFNTLLICYNQELAYFMASQFKDKTNITVTTFHKLCVYYINAAFKISGIDYLRQVKRELPNSDHFSVHLPIAMSYAMESVDLRYDAIVCDEGQDFGEEFWLPIELALSDLTSSPFYIFYDTHQNLYSRSLSFPIPDAPFTLQQNCRNSRQIHELAYKNYAGPSVESPLLDARPIQFIVDDSIKQQAQKLHSHIATLISTGGVIPEKIVVLIGDNLNKASRYEYLEQMNLPKGVKWNREGGIKSGTVLLETVKRFKGLESEVVCLWGLPGDSSYDFEEVLYVGATRAVSDLTLVLDSGERTRIE